MPKFNNIHDAIRNNEQKKCSVKSCYNGRYRIGSLWESCGRQRWRWGHPEAKAIYKKDYRYEYKIVQKVISKNPNHDGINHGITFRNTYLERFAQGATHLPGSKHAKRLYDLGVTGNGILTELAAIYMLSGNFYTPVKDHRHLKYLLGSKFIQFILGAGKVKGTENRDIGEYLNENIGVLLLNISKTARKTLIRD